MHDSRHPLADQTVTVLPAAPLFRYTDTAPIEFRIEDWHDRVFGQSWMNLQGNAASLGYAVRSATGGLPTDNEVVYGKCPNGMGHLVHISEIKDGV